MCFYGFSLKVNKKISRISIYAVVKMTDLGKINLKNKCQVVYLLSIF